MVLILVATAGARDTPSLVYYGPTLVVGVMLYLHRPWNCPADLGQGSGESGVVLNPLPPAAPRWTSGDE